MKSEKQPTEVHARLSTLSSIVAAVSEIDTEISAIDATLAQLRTDIQQAGEPKVTDEPAIELAAKRHARLSIFERGAAAARKRADENVEALKVALIESKPFCLDLVKHERKAMLAEIETALLPFYTNFDRAHAAAFETDLGRHVLSSSHTWNRADTDYETVPMSVLLFVAASMVELLTEAAKPNGNLRRFLSPPAQVSAV